PHLGFGSGLQPAYRRREAPFVEDRKGLRACVECLVRRPVSSYVRLPNSEWTTWKSPRSAPKGVHFTVRNRGQFSAGSPTARAKASLPKLYAKTLLMWSKWAFANASCD